MERRLLKDFQIGFVEGVIHDAIQSEKEPKDVFSKIAKAIGKKKASGKDWNAEVRRRTSKKDPIGSTNEMAIRRSQQSLRRHIIQNENTALKSMDQEKLVQYNPKLNVVPPAARIAYAKFKMPKIKQEYEITGGDEEGDDQVFQEGSEKPAGDAQPPKPRTSANTSITSVASAIARPRPQSKRKMEKQGAVEPPKPAESNAEEKKADTVVVDMEPKGEAGASSAEPPVEQKKAEANLEAPKPKSPDPPKRAPTPIPEEPKEPSVKEPSVKEPSPEASPEPSPKSSSPAASEGSTIAAKTPEPKREPIKPGKSKVTGEILTGWL